MNQSKKEAYERKGSKAEVPGFDMEACLVELAQRQIDYEELEADLTTRVVATTVACQHNPQNLIKLSQEVDSSIIDLRYVKSVVWWKEALEYTLTFSLLPFLECKMQQKSHGKNLMQSFLKLTWTYTSNPADFGEMNDKRKLSQVSSLGIERAAWENFEEIGY